MIFSVLLLLQAAPAPAAPAPEKPAEKVRCRTYQETGSLVATKRVCLTPSQWKAQERETQRAVDTFQQSGAANSPR
ncbi:MULTISPECIES: hypothetical protein [Sphingomonas]|uniref:hypothetical protein n=1 Tax=Sphingomonas TaxID=13687 RepID=UPI00092819EA|nr:MULTISPECIES: hypothetical protein [Sphingomonas]MCW6532638.1 hypothetical protein [Sphingomonas lycopersici]OJU15920.1 MAG: hypothetical protein BGN95_09270 [Sphingomonas sp. 66-10]